MATVRICFSIEIHLKKGVVIVFVFVFFWSPEVLLLIEKDKVPFLM